MCSATIWNRIGIKFITISISVIILHSNFNTYSIFQCFRIENGSKSIRKQTVTPVTFGGQTSVKIPSGEAVVSDEITFEVSKGNDISVSMYFADFTLMRSAVNITGPLSKGFYSAARLLLMYLTTTKKPMVSTKPTGRVTHADLAKPAIT